MSRAKVHTRCILGRHPRFRFHQRFEFQVWHLNLITTLDLKGTDRKLVTKITQNFGVCSGSKNILIILDKYPLRKDSADSGKLNLSIL